MTRHELLNGIRSLHCIEAFELSLPPDKAAAFVRDPVAFFLRADDPTADAIWNVVKACQPSREVNIEIMAYRGKNGGYAVTHVPLWLVRIVGADGSKRVVEPNGWHGVNNQGSARQIAEDWSKFLGVPVREVDGGEKLNGMPPD